MEQPSPDDADTALADPAALRAAVRAMMSAHWRPGGYTVPNAEVYPWQWLWDSCFHALIWAELGEAERAVTELRSLFSDQDELGFVPHVRYGAGPYPYADFWGVRTTSSITQPPMYGHAIAGLERQGVDVPDDVRDAATRALRFLLHHRRRTPGGLITVVHPWETGCDDSPRWDHWCHPWELGRWYDIKGALLDTVVRAPSGAPLANPAFAVAPAGFNALIAWNASELGLSAEADELTEALSARWDGELATWVDDGPSAESSGRVRTLDALLPLLLTNAGRVDARRDAAVRALSDPAGFRGPFGPAAVHRAEPSFDPTAYWRGSVWPQLSYLLSRSDDTWAGPAFVAGAMRSGLAEHWHPDTGHGLGARPQSWTGLAILLADH